MNKKQKGFSLIELMFVIAISTSMIVMLAKEFKKWVDVQLATRDGIIMANYTAAVASYVTNEPVRLAQLSPPQTMPMAADDSVVHFGFGWLQDAATCPGATGAVAYLPCNFANSWTNPYNILFVTYVHPEPPQFVRAETFFGRPSFDGINSEWIRAGIITNIAESHVTSLTASIERTSGMIVWRIDPDYAPSGQIISTVTTAVLGQPWLRTDGSNQMTAALNMGGNDINGARDVNANRDLIANHNVTARNTVTAVNNINAGNNVTAGMSIEAAENITSLGGNVVALNGDVNAGQNVNAGNDVVAQNNVDAQNDVRVTGATYTNPFTNNNEAISLSSAVWGMTYVDNSSNIVNKPTCPTGKTAQLFTVPGQWSVGGVAEPVGGIDLSQKDRGRFWEVYLILYTASKPNGYIPQPGTATILVSLSCQ